MPAGSRTLLVVDQFEELFTLTSDMDKRLRFIDSLLRAATSEGDRLVYVALTLRADFYAQCWQHSALLEHVARHQYPVRRMPVDRLRELIEKPLNLAGVDGRTRFGGHHPCRGGQ